jgi:hypothetical protein
MRRRHASGRRHRRGTSRELLEGSHRLRGNVSSTMSISVPAVQLIGLPGMLSMTRRPHREKKRSGSVAVGKGLGLLHRGVTRLSTNSKGHKVAACLGERKERGPGVISTSKGGRTARAAGRRQRGDPHSRGSRVHWGGDHHGQKEGRRRGQNNKKTDACWCENDKLPQRLPA